MARMRRMGRVFLLVAMGALVLIAAAGAQAGDAAQPSGEQYWLGPYFAGLRLTHVSSGSPDKTFAYGDCEIAPGAEGGCSVPAQVQNSSSCDRNPLAIDRVPSRVFLVRGGGLAVEYERTGIDVTTGSRTVTLYAEFELMGAALREVSRQSDSIPQPLAPPEYPPAALRELKRVTAAASRYHGVGAIARATGLPPAEVNVRLRIAALLGPEALAGVPVPKISTTTVERLRQLAFRSQLDLGRAARKRGISKAALLAKIRPVRGLTGYCWPDPRSGKAG